MSHRCLLVALVLLVLGACEKEDAEGEYETQGRVTMMVTTEGLGDNGRNDDAVGGVFEYAKRTGAKVGLLRPKSVEEAREMYEEWLTETAETDSAVLIVGGSEYAGMVKEVGDISKEDGEVTSGRRRVLLMDSKEKGLPKGVSSVYISRAGVSYLAGCMSKDYGVFVVTSKRDEEVEEAATAFMNGYRKHKATDIEEIKDLCLETDDSGLDHNYIHFTVLNLYPFFCVIYPGHRMVLPLIRIGDVAIIQILNEAPLFDIDMIGMDVDQSVLSDKIPFSIVYRVGDALGEMLGEWREGEAWGKVQVYGMEEGKAEIVMSEDYESEYGIDYKELKKQYYEEAKDVDRQYREEIAK